MDGGGAEAEHLGSFLDAVVAVGAGEEEELEVIGRVAVFFRVWIKGIAGDDYGRCVRN